MDGENLICHPDLPGGKSEVQPNHIALLNGCVYITLYRQAPASIEPISTVSIIHIFGVGSAPEHNHALIQKHEYPVKSFYFKEYLSLHDNMYFDVSNVQCKSCSLGGTQTIFWWTFCYTLSHENYVKSAILFNVQEILVQNVLINNSVSNLLRKSGLVYNKNIAFVMRKCYLKKLPSLAL